jgi:hypothetical protein
MLLDKLDAAPERNWHVSAAVGERLQPIVHSALDDSNPGLFGELSSSLEDIPD